MISQKTKQLMQLKWFMFIVPSLILYLVFFIIPASSSLFYSFTDWDGGSYKFIGIQNYVDMFSDKRILTSFGNTVMYSAFITVFQNLLALAIAMFMVQKLIGVKYLRLMFFMPIIFSSLVVGYIWGFILEPNSGVLNNLLSMLNLEFLQANWLGDPSYGRWMVILVTIWQSMGYSMVIYIAGLNTVPSEMYEAADIDGANGFQKFKCITFPLIAPSFTINLMLSTIGCLKIFDQIFALTGGGPGYTTQSVATMIYQLGFGADGGKWGYGSAMSIVLFGVIIILTGIQVSVLRKREVDY